MDIKVDKSIKVYILSPRCVEKMYLRRKKIILCGFLERSVFAGAIDFGICSSFITRIIVDCIDLWIDGWMCSRSANTISIAGIAMDQLSR